MADTLYIDSLISILSSTAIVWGIGLAPPLTIRFAIIRHYLSTKWAIGITAVLFIVNILIFNELGATWKTNWVLFLVAFASYVIMRIGANKSAKEIKITDETISAFKFLLRFVCILYLFFVASVLALIVIDITQGKFVAFGNEDLLIMLIGVFLAFGAGYVKHRIDMSEEQDEQPSELDDQAKKKQLQERLEQDRLKRIADEKTGVKNPWTD